MEKKYTHQTANGCPAYELGRIDSNTPRVFVVRQGNRDRVYTLTEDLKYCSTAERAMLTEWSPWMDVPLNTPIWVRHDEFGPWGSAHFADYRDGKVWAFRAGCTSHTTKEKEPWERAVAESPFDNKADPMVDWKKVWVDTPIWVRGREDEDWDLRYFASVDDNGTVYAWLDGKKSRDFKDSRDFEDKWFQKVSWNYAKLAGAATC